MCFNEIKDTAIGMCGHVSTCLTCTKMLMDQKDSCPMCRGQISSYVQLKAWVPSRDWVCDMCLSVNQGGNMCVTCDTERESSAGAGGGGGGEEEKGDGDCDAGVGRHEYGVCMICNENESNTVVEPCGHHKFCQDCVIKTVMPEKCPSCPLCLQEVTKQFQLFMS